MEFAASNLAVSALAGVRRSANRQTTLIGTISGSPCSGEVILRAAPTRDQRHRSVLGTGPVGSAVSPERRRVEVHLNRRGRLVARRRGARAQLTVRGRLDCRRRPRTALQWLGGVTVEL